VFGDTPTKQTVDAGPPVSRHNNQINVKILGGLFDYFCGPSNLHDKLVPHLGLGFSRDLLEPELARFRRNRDVVSKFGGVTHRYELYVHQVQQRVAFSSELRRLVKRGDRLSLKSIGQRILRNIVAMDQATFH
jgi:hypothetical protein